MTQTLIIYIQPHVEMKLLKYQKGKTNLKTDGRTFKCIISLYFCSYDSPLALGIYGYVESSYFILDVYENPDIPYPYRYVVMEMATTNPKESQKDNDGQQTINRGAKDDSENQKRSLKRKRTKNSSSIPSIFSILEVLQLIFL